MERLTSELNLRVAARAMRDLAEITVSATMLTQRRPSFAKPHEWQLCTGYARSLAFAKWRLQRLGPNLHFQLSPLSEQIPP